ncbi:MAG: hypothetical protein V4655_10615 [Bdellovibrionota bacterium]
MNRKVFETIISRIPHLTADGLMDISKPEFALKRRDFVRSAKHLNQAIAASRYLQGIGKSSRFSRWQRSSCTHTHLKDLLEWSAGEEISEGAFIAAALHQGFTMGVQDGTLAYFNFLVPQMEYELERFREVSALRKVVGA